MGGRAVKYTYTQVCTLLHAVLDLCPDPNVREAIADHDKELRENADMDRARVEHLADQLYEGIVNGQWEEEEESFDIDDLSP